MHSHLLQTHSLVRVGHQDLLAEMLSVVAQSIEWSHCVISLLQVQISDIGVGVVLILACEGRLSG